jgi:lysozyme
MDGHQYTARFEAPGGEPVLDAYLDTLGIATIGIGHTGPEVHLGLHWPRDRCFAIYYSDYAIAEGHAPLIIGSDCWYRLIEPRRAVIVDLCFNPGPTRLKGFLKMLAAIKRGDWKAAHDELLDSLYAKQVKTRATMNASVLLTGLWPEDQVTA